MVEFFGDGLDLVDIAGAERSAVDFDKGNNIRVYLVDKVSDAEQVAVLGADCSGRATTNAYETCRTGRFHRQCCKLEVSFAVPCLDGLFKSQLFDRTFLHKRTTAVILIANLIGASNKLLVFAMKANFLIVPFYKENIIN